MKYLAGLLFLIPLTASGQEKPSADPTVRMREAWPKLLEAWKTTTACKADLAKEIEGGRMLLRSGDPRQSLLPDSVLRSLGQVSAALEAAGLLSEGLAPELESFKDIYKSRISSLVRLQGMSLLSVPRTQEEFNRFQQEYNRLSQQLQQEYSQGYQEFQSKAHGGRPARASAPKAKSPVADLEEAAAALHRMKDAADREEDLEADALAKLRGSLRDLGVMDDETPPWMRSRLTALVRALAIEEAVMPEAAKATPELERKVDDLISVLTTGEIEVREEATRELSRIGEPCLKKLREALAETQDPETKVRLRKVLGYPDGRPSSGSDAEPDADPRTKRSR